MYKVLRYFRDKEDGEYKYQAGDQFPRDGMNVSQERIAELSGANNLQGVKLIEFVDDGDAEKEQAEANADGATVYTEEALSNMTRNDIGMLAEKMGYKITATNKTEIIAEFLMQQNG